MNNKSENIKNFIKNKFCIKLLTIEKTIFNDYAYLCNIKTENERISICSKHENFISKIVPGEIILYLDNFIYNYYISYGLLEMKDNFLTIFGDNIIFSSNLNKREVINIKNKIESDLKTMSPNNKSYNELNIELLKAVAKLKILDKL